MLTIVLGVALGIFGTLVILASGSLDCVQRALPSIGRLPLIKDRGYRVFAVLFDQPDDARTDLARRCHRFAIDVRDTLDRRSAWVGSIPLSPHAKKLQGYIYCHYQEGVRLYHEAAKLGAATGWTPAPSNPTPVALDEVPAFFETIAARLERRPLLRRVSAALRTEVPAHMDWIGLKETN